MSQVVRGTADTLKTIMVAGGGTAGHIEPALAVADAIRGFTPPEDQKFRIIALGTHKGLDAVLIPQRGYELEYTDPIPLPRTINWTLLTLPFRIIKSVWKTRRIIHKHRVKAIIGFGGYVALSAYLAARIPPRVPVIVHEANIRPGLANKIGSRLAYLSVTSHAIPGFGSMIVGTPVRKSIAHLDRAAIGPTARQKFGIPDHGKVVFVFGGSQGARNINRALAEVLPTLMKAGIHIIHAYGAQNEPIIFADAANSSEKLVSGSYLPFAYIEDMSAAYAACDLVIARSGAMTVAELSSLGIPAIYIPLGHGNGEQALNAATAVKAGAAIILEDASLEGRELEQEIISILGATEPVQEGYITEKSFPDRYIHMYTQAQRLVSVDAAETIAQLVVGLINAD